MITTTTLETSQNDTYAQQHHSPKDSPKEAEETSCTTRFSMGAQPALILVNINNGFARSDSPVGGDFSRVIGQNKRLLSVFRQRDLPIFFTSVVFDDAKILELFFQRASDFEIFQAGTRWVEIVHELERRKDEPVIEKASPSGFKDTCLAERLEQSNVDTLVVSGLGTSESIKATVLDGLRLKYPVFVPYEACGDRNLKAQQVHLQDMNTKHANVVSIDDLIERIRKRPS